MGKVLKISFPHRCIGCELCVMEAQRQLNKIGLDGALIRILRDQTDDTKKSAVNAEGKNINVSQGYKTDKPVDFAVDVDPNINTLDIQKIKEICPTMVFSIEETDEDYGLLR